MEVVSTVSTQDVKSIPRGETRVFHLDHPRKLQTARSLAGQIWKSYPELGVKYRCSCDYSKVQISITSEPISKP